MYQFEFLKYVVKHPEMKNESFYGFSHNFIYKNFPSKVRLWIFLPLTIYYPFPEIQTYRKHFKFFGIIIYTSFIGLATCFLILLFGTHD